MAKHVFVRKIKKGEWIAKCTFPGCKWQYKAGRWDLCASQAWMHKHDD